MTSIEKPLVSIVIPTRDRPIEFEKAVESVLTQTYENKEIIVVTDGISDQFIDAYRTLKSKFQPQNVKFMHLMIRENGHGHCFARNEGVKQANGQIIGFLDDDDVWIDPTFLARAVVEMVSQKSQFLFANQKAIDIHGNYVSNIWVENLVDKIPSTDARNQLSIMKVSIDEILSAKSFAHQNTWLIDKHLYSEVGGMDENLRYEPDRDCFLRLIDKAENILYDTAYIALHYIPDKSKSDNASTKTNLLQKRLFQLRTVDKSILFSENETIRKFSTLRKSYLLRHIAEELYQKGEFKHANRYALQAIGVSFSIKFVILILFRNLFRFLRKK